jgi:hypothetical protein
MIEIAEEFVETVQGRQVLVAVALVVFAELTRRITLRLENRRHGHVGLLPAFRSSGHAHLGHAGSERIGSPDEGGAAGRTALLTVIVREGKAFLRDSVDIGSPVTHQPAIVEADVRRPDVVAPDDQDVRLLLLRRGGLRQNCSAYRGKGHKNEIL